MFFFFHFECFSIQTVTSSVAVSMVYDTMYSVNNPFHIVSPQELNRITEIFWKFSNPKQNLNIPVD